MTRTPEADPLTAEVERHREQLAETVDALQHQLDVKVQAKHKASHMRDRATAGGKPRPELVGGLLAVALIVGFVAWRRRR